MTARKKPDAAPPTPADSVDRAIRLLEWGRKRHFRIGATLVVGDVTMQVEDLVQAKRHAPDPDEGDADVYAMAGATDEPAEGT